MTDLARIIDSLSEQEIKETNENVRVNYETYSEDSRMNMIAFD